MSPLATPTAAPMARQSAMIGHDDHHRDQRADREVELAGHDHEVLARGEDGQRRRALEERQEAGRLQEIRVLDRDEREEDEQDDEDRRRPHQRLADALAPACDRGLEAVCGRGAHALRSDRRA
jgi:hypothetical protein